MQERVQVPLISDLPDRHLREQTGHRAPGLFEHLECFHVKTSRSQISFGHCMPHFLLAALRQEPLMAHAGNFYIQFPGSGEKPRVLLQRFLIGRHGIFQNLCKVHP